MKHVEDQGLGRDFGRAGEVVVCSFAPLVFLKERAQGQQLLGRTGGGF